MASCTVGFNGAALPVLFCRICVFVQLVSAERDMLQRAVCSRWIARAVYFKDSSQLFCTSNTATIADIMSPETSVTIQTLRKAAWRSYAMALATALDLFSAMVASPLLRSMRRTFRSTGSTDGHHVPNWQSLQWKFQSAPDIFSIYLVY